MSVSTKLTANQSAILDVLRGNGASTVAEIGETLSETKLSAISAGIRALEKRGIVKGDDAGRFDEVLVDTDPAAEATEEAADAKKTPALPGVMGAAVTVAIAQAEKGVERELTTSGYAKTVTVKVGDDVAYVTLDGAFIVAKTADDHKKPWVLHQHRAGKVAVLGDSYKSSSAALSADNLG